MKVVLALVLVILALSLEVRATELESLIERVKHTQNTDAGISLEEQKLSEKIHAIGPKAIPSLLPLLQDPNRNVRDLAAYTLGQIDGLTEKDLDALVASCHREEGGGWIPAAIARIGTPKAVDCLFEEFRRRPAAESQIAWSIVWLKDKSVPRLLHIYETDQGWSKSLDEAMEYIFHNLGPSATAAVDPLLRIANNERAEGAMRIRATRALGAIGLTAERTEPDLLKLTDDYDPRVRQAATDAILAMGCSAAAPILAQRLDDPKYAADRCILLREISALHSRGRAVGPTVAKYLSGDDREVRVCAARTLGYIGYQNSKAELLSLLDSTEDWRLVLSAAESLGRMEVNEALPALRRISQHHWYPPVRTAATKATAGIRNHVHHEEQWFPSEFFSYQEAGGNLDKLTNVEEDRVRLPVVNATASIPDAARTNMRRFGVIRCAIKVDDGYLVGRYFNSESSAEIALADFDQVSLTIVSGDYTEALYQTEGGILAISSREDHSGGQGLIYQLKKDTTGKWQAKPWRQLPGAPAFSRLLQDGRLFINCSRGMVIVSMSGDMQLLTRKQVLGNSIPRH